MIHNRQLLITTSNLYKLTHHLSSLSRSHSFVSPTPFTPKLTFLTSAIKFTSNWSTPGLCNDFKFVGQVSFMRCYCNDSGGSKEFTEEIEYLEESGSVIYKGKGIRSVEPGIDDHVMVGEVKKPFLNSLAVAKIVEVVKRWKWGPELDTQLDKLQFVPNMIHITQALKVINDGDGCLSLFRLWV